jgi:hypothetical protein
MVLSTTNPMGWKATDFALKGIDGKTYSLADVRGSKGTVVAFICNHCPYVKASINRIVAEAKVLLISSAVSCGSASRLSSLSWALTLIRSCSTSTPLLLRKNGA